ncbi:hypothetical protein ACHAWF_012952 [Thalassiosira exigua]
MQSSKWPLPICSWPTASLTLLSKLPRCLGTTFLACAGVYDCSKHLAGGGSKDAPYITTLFAKYLVIYDPDKTLLDTVFFDGASNVQKAREVITAHYPRAAVMCGTDHVVSLFFCDIAKCSPIKVSFILKLQITIDQQITLSFQRLIKKIFRLCNVIRSGVTQVIYAIFAEISVMMNNRNSIYLLCGTRSRFASFF